MPDIHFSSLDLNLLRVFHALAEEGSVTRAGARLGLTQSAVSHALNRLRHLVGDELFIRGPNGMRPTPRALEIAPRLGEGLRQIQIALAPTAFVPEEAHRRFILSAAAYTSTVLMPRVIAEMRKSAPGVEISLRMPGSTLGEDLLAGRIDMVLGAFGRASAGYERETLFSESMIWAIRASHPAARLPTLTLETLAALPHIILASAQEDQAVDGQVFEGGLERRVIWDDRRGVDAVLERAGLRRRIALTLQDAHSALAIVSHTDMAALAPRRLAESLAGQFGLKLFEPPYPSPPVGIEAVWRLDIGGAPHMVWLRDCLRAAAAGL
ncbi:MAG: LysR family transcriptional regulator [Caulobacteraceae bacterium]|nr:LysR family transcriptional regulator [Caulobacteraceae bacterium]